MSDQHSPAKKSFDCVAFQHGQREKLVKKFEGMNSGETGVWMRDYRPTDPILRRFTERTGWRGANDPVIEPKVAAEQPEE